MKKAVAIKLNDHYAKLTDGSCPSHHSPNDVIPLSNDNSSASGRLKEICPRGNNKVVIYISVYHDKCFLSMLELY